MYHVYGLDIRADRVGARHVRRHQVQSTRGLNLDHLIDVATAKTLCVVKPRSFGGGDLIDCAPDDIRCSPGCECIDFSGPVSKANLVKAQDVRVQLSDRHDDRQRRAFTKPFGTQGWNRRQSTSRHPSRADEGSRVAVAKSGANVENHKLLGLIWGSFYARAVRNGR